MRSGLVLASAGGARVRPRVSAGPAAPGDTRILSYRGAAKTSRQVWIYSPPRYDPDHANPLAYLLYHPAAEHPGSLTLRQAARTLDSLVARGLMRATVVISPLSSPARRPARPDPDGLPAMHALLSDTLPFVEQCHRIPAGEPVSIAVISKRPRRPDVPTGASCNVFTEDGPHEQLDPQDARFFRLLFWWARQFRPRLDLRLAGVTILDGDRQQGAHPFPGARFVERHYLSQVMPLVSPFEENPSILSR